MADDTVDSESAEAIERIAARSGCTPHELVDLARHSPVLMRQLLDQDFAALAEPPAEPGFRLMVDCVLDAEAAEKEN
jgi:hypothetical protein